nr:LuxR C-terminal-related transcriptional regulator [Amycolatopsis antarctica]
MVSLDRSLRVTAANQEMFELFYGLDDDICGTALCDLIDPSIRTKVRSRLERLLEGQQTRFDERAVDLIAPDGAVPADLIGTSVSRGTNQVVGVVVFGHLLDETTHAAKQRASRRQLSEMDAAILERIAAGTSTVQMAASLFLSRGGVEYHMTALLRKMHAKNRTALISKAYSLGYFEVSSWPPRVVPERIQ